MSYGKPLGKNLSDKSQSVASSRKKLESENVQEKNSKARTEERQTRVCVEQAQSSGVQTQSSDEQAQAASEQAQSSGEQAQSAGENHTGGNKPRQYLFRRFLIRHIVLAVSLALLCAYYILREIPAVANFATTYIAHPWHRFAGRISGCFPFSLAEWLCVLAVTGIAVYLVVTLVKFILKPEKLMRAYATLITILAAVLMVYALICWLWGITYYSYTFTELSGIETEEVSVKELKEVAIYFAEVANEAAGAVDRDENGLYTCDLEKTLSESPALYTNLPGDITFLEGPELHPKSMAFSYVMCHMNFTGVFFPFTGEANINVLTPDCYLPSTVAHELAHQRGVTREQDANFTAVMVCMESGKENFIYSGALLAYTHLSNTLRQASYEDWEEVRSYLGEGARRDLAANNEFWAKFQSPAADISETAYEEFLQNQGQELGMRSYGACVDLLVAYYGEVAASK